VRTLTALDDFQGDTFSPEERKYRLLQLESEIKANNVDPEFIPYLKKINESYFFITTQCCTGHGPVDDRRAHFDFRSAFKPKTVIDRILKPLDRKYPEVSVSLYGLHCDRLRYCIWMPGEKWEEIVNYFLKLIEQIEGFNATKIR